MTRVCMIIEGSYPYVLGGVGRWAQRLIEELSDIEFSLVTISATPKTDRDYRYRLPSNIVKIYNISLDDHSILHTVAKRKRRIRTVSRRRAWEEIRQFYTEMEQNEFQRFMKIYQLLVRGRILDARELFLSRTGWDMVSSYYQKLTPIDPFVDFYWACRTTHLLLYHIICANLPVADVYHAISTGYAGLSGVCANARFGKPLLLTEHGTYTQEREVELFRADWLTGYQRDLWAGIFRKVGQLTYNYSSKIISLYEEARKKQIEMGAPPDRTEVIPNGVDIERFSTIGRSVSKEKPLIGLVGRVVRIKDIKTFISACKIISLKIPQAQFLIIGPYDEEVAYFEECQLMCKHLEIEDKITFTSRVDVTDYYRRLDVLALTSLKESQPLVILEAMCAGVPVVATETGSIPEMLEGTGVVTPPKDPQSIADSVIKLLHDNVYRNKLIESAHRKVREKYNIQKIVSRYRDIYQTATRKG